MIIIEGLDNTGKTTLAERILTDFPELQLRASIGNKHDLDMIRTQAQDEAMYDHPLMVADRSRLISEYVYNPVLQGRELAFPYISWLFWLAHFTSKQHLIIHCHRDVDHITQSFEDQEQLEGVRENLFALDIRYIQMMEMIQLLFDVQEDNYSKIISWNFEYPAQYSYIKECINIYLKEVS